MEQSKSLILISGSGRSGTTLLSNIINRHPNCICGTENDFITRFILLSNKNGIINSNKAKLIITNLWITKKAFSNDWNINEQRILNNYTLFKTEKISIKLICNKLIESYTPEKNATVLLDKNPFYLQYIPLIEKKLSPNKYIFIVRHPLDKFSSEKRLNKSFISYGISWAYQQKKIIKASKRSNCLILKYEDLILNETQTIKKVCSFLNIQFDKSFFINKNKRVFDGKKMKNWHELSNENITSSRINIWKDQLTKREVKIVSFFCNKVSKKYDYHLPKISFVEKIFISIFYSSFTIIPYVYPKLKLLYFMVPIKLQKFIVKIKTTFTKN